jgi:hypothetical protein
MVKTFEQFKEGGLELSYYSLDWDDNILHMPTKILMDQKVGEDSWEQIEVSTAEFAKVRNDKENYRIRNNDPKEAFSEFRDTGSRGDIAFLQDVQIALSNRAFAPSWDAFIKCLSDGSLFSIITARGHEPDSIRKGVEFIIDNYLTKQPSMNPGFSLADEMYQHLKKFHYMFNIEKPVDDDHIKGTPSQNPLVKSYLDSCSFFGVSSTSFAKQFGEASASNPEAAKEIALNYFVERCNEFGERIGAKTVSVGFSDDDPKNVEHVEKFFKEKLPNMSGSVKFSLYKTTDPTIKGGEITKFQQETPVEEKVMLFSEWNISETSNQAVGMESSILPHKMNMTQNLYPSTPDAPKDDFHNRMKNQTKAAIDLYDKGKRFAFRRKKNKFKK